MTEPELPPTRLFRFFSRLLSRWLSPRDHPVVMSELIELYRTRQQRWPRSQRSWLYRQLLQYPLYLLWENYRRPDYQTADAPRFATDKQREPMRTLSQDLRHSLTSLLRTPVVTSVVILTVGLAIGANTAIFALIQGVLLNPLSYPEPDRLVRIVTQPSPERRWPLSVVDYQALNKQQTVFTQVAGFANSVATFNRDEIAERIRGRFVTWSYFPLLGISPLHGRLFSETDDLPGAEPTVIISHAFWVRYLEGETEAIGQTIRLNGVEYRVIGVLPEQPGALEAEREFFAAARWAAPSRKGPFFVQGLGRVKPGLDREAVEAELLAVNRRLFPVWESSFQDRNAVWGQHDLREAIIGEIDKTLYLAFAAVLFVFLIASANAANLLVARSSYRRRELAVRSALGASRSRLLLHLWSENLLLATGASLLAMGVAGGGIRLLQTAGAAFVPRSQEIGLHGPVIWFLLASTVISMILFGFLPSLGLADSNLGQVLHSGSRSVSGARGLQRMRRALVITEVAVAVPLLIGGGLLVGSLVRLQQVDVGFDPAHILTLEVSLPETYDDMASVHQFWNRTLERIRSLSTVSQAGFADGRPPL